MCPFLVDAREAAESLPVLAQRADDIAGELRALTDAPPVPPPDRGAIARLRDAAGVWALYDAAVRRFGGDVRAATARVAMAERRAMDLANEGAGEVDLESEGPTQAQAQAARAAATSAATVAATAAADLSAARARHDLACREHDRLLAERVRLEAECADVAPLQLLVDALGPQGIQALAIAAAGPGVSDLANDLLEACFDGRFQVEIETVKTIKSGEQRETCDLRVIDTVWGQVHESIVAGPSGGEGVVIDEAMRLALTLHTLRTARVRWRTLWRDETVGQLDPVACGRYAALLRRACDLGGIHQVLVVSHSGGEGAGLDSDGGIWVTDGGEVVQ